MRIAMPIAAGFEDSEFSVPYERLRAAGHEITLIGSKSGEWLQGKRGRATAVPETTAEDLEVNDFDALLIPGGHSPDRLRLDEALVGFARAFCESGKPVAAICHGPQLLIEADAVGGRTLTSWPSLRKDLENAGATWIDQEVVVNGNLITSRKPEDLDAFCAALQKQLDS
jgi:protease I